MKVCDFHSMDGHAATARKHGCIIKFTLKVSQVDIDATCQMAYGYA